jgi:hypothetical protein
MAVMDIPRLISQYPKDTSVRRPRDHPWEEFERAPLLPIYNKPCSADASSLTGQEGMTVVSIMIPEMIKAKLALSSPDEFGNGRDRTRSVACKRMNALTSAFAGLISDPQA